MENLTLKKEPLTFKSREFFLIIGNLENELLLLYLKVKKFFKKQKKKKKREREISNAKFVTQREFPGL